MAAVDQVSTAFQQLDNVESKTSFDDWAQLVGFQFVGHGFKFRHEGASFLEAEVAALWAAAGVVAEFFGQGGEVFAGFNSFAQVFARGCRALVRSAAFTCGLYTISRISTSALK